LVGARRLGPAEPTSSRSAHDPLLVGRQEGEQLHHRELAAARSGAQLADHAGHPLEAVDAALAEGHLLLDWSGRNRRARLSDELCADVVGEILLARLERQDPVARATAWLRAERSWRHHLAPLLEAGLCKEPVGA
jgi:hypothetical protein